MSKKTRLQKYIHTHRQIIVLAGSAFMFICIGVIILFLAQTTRTQQEKTRVEASDKLSNQELRNSYMNRVPEGEPLIHLDVRHDQANLTPQQRESAKSAISFVVNYPYLPGGHASWRDPQTGRVIAERRWPGMKELFPMSDLDYILDNYSSEEAVQALEDRHEAIYLFYDRFYGEILNQTLFSSYRVEIFDFPEWIRDADMYNSRFQEELGIQTDILEQNPNIISLKVLADHGYKQLEVLIPRNVYGSVRRSLDNEYFSLYGELSSAGVELMADAVKRTDSILTESSPDTTVRYLYMNEVDLVGCFHGNDCATNRSAYYSYKYVNPTGYARSYYNLAEELIKSDITLMPSALAFIYGRYDINNPNTFYDGSNGINPWVGALASEASRRLGNNSSINNDLGINFVGDTESLKSFISRTQETTRLANQRYGSNLQLGRIQEVGMVPHLPQRDSYINNLSIREEEFRQMLDYLQSLGINASIYGQTAVNLAPWDGKLPTSLLEGSSAFKLGFIYRDEPRIWRVIREKLNGQLGSADFFPDESLQSGSETGTTGNTSVQQDTEITGEYEIQSIPEENVNCPDEARNAGVANTCPADQNWRGCYCDTNTIVNDMYVWVNSCGEEGQEEYIQTNIRCGDPNPQVEAPDGSCIKTPPNDQVAQADMFDDAMKRFCFELENERYKTCTGNSDECEWCFAGYCLNKD